KDFGETVLENFELCGRTLFQFFPVRWHVTQKEPAKTGLVVEGFPVPHDEIFYNEFDIEVIAVDAVDNLRLWVRHRLDVLTSETAEQLLEDMKCELQQIAKINA